MSQLEYLTVLVSIIVGIGITDLAKSVRNLLHPDRPVRWHWLPLTWALAAIFMVVGAWWIFFRVLQGEVWTNPFAFLLVLFTTLNLYFLCAFALPELDGPPEVENPDRVDLEDFYFSASHRRAFFGVAIAFAVSFWALVGTWRVTALGRMLSQEIANSGQNVLMWAVPYGFMIGTDRKWVHILLTMISIVLVAVLVFQIRSMVAGG